MARMARVVIPSVPHHITQQPTSMVFDMNSLPEFIKNKILELPEYSYGVNRVTLVLDDGSTYDEVYIGWGEEIIKVGNQKGVPFDPARVVKVITSQ